MITTIYLNSALSFSASVVAVVMALAALAMSRDPRARALRWFAAAALLAATFSAGNIVVGLPVAEIFVERAARLSMAAACLHGAAWFVYDAQVSGRPLDRVERALVAGAVVFALAAFVPGLLVSSTILSRSAWFGLVYRDAAPTALGGVVYVYNCVGLAILAARFGRRLARGDRSQTLNLVGVGALCAGGVSDSLAASQVTHVPYVLDLALMVMILSVGTSFAKRYLENAAALEASALRLAATQRELVQRERLAALGEMSAIVAHEVRNPVAVMFNALASLRREVRPDDSPRAGELLGILQEEADRLRRLVDDFLDFVRPVSLRRERAELTPLVQGAVDAAREAIADARPVTVHVEASVAGALWCDPQLVRHAVVNLVTNALQADGAQRGVEVWVAARGEWLRIEVRDHGEGVPPDVEPRLFSPFVTSRATGTGLGLAVVKRIAEAHGGGVSHGPTPGGGATFSMDLPRSAPDAAAG